MLGSSSPGGGVEFYGNKEKTLCIESEIYITQKMCYFHSKFLDYVYRAILDTGENQH
jgi:hypothetical protein